MTVADSLNRSFDTPDDRAEDSGTEVVSVDVISPDITPVVMAETPPDWETLSFPQALDVEQLPAGESIDLVTSLEQQNQTLRDRVAYLEGALAHSQSTLRQELEHWEDLALSGDERIQAKDTAIAKHMEEITTAQEKITHLFQDLERGHQTTQRQQILIDTLNTQLQNSQERVAQLERECSATQQQYVDQAQIAMQQELQCRDLQARLHRQQRYTLQYKAALEKCLEVPSPIANVPALLAETINTNHNIAVKQVNMPKPTPVQPWSAPPEEEANELNQGAWLNSFLSDSDQFPATEAVTNFDWHTDVEPQHLSFDLDGAGFDPNLLRSDLQAELAKAGLSIDARSVAWESTDHNTDHNTNHNTNHNENDDVALNSPSRLMAESGIPSPFITLKPMTEDDLAEAGEVPMRKRESLAAVDLPTFPHPVESLVQQATAVAVKAGK
jgi:hypothetical protein